MADKKDTRICINNREITHKYEILERIECGIELQGTEVKSIRDSKCNLKNSFALINGGEVILKNMHISPYEMGNINNVPEKKDRKLLLHKLEILKIIGYIKQGGYTLVPSKIYMRGRWFKVELCVCKGKKIYDKRDIILQNEAKRQINEFKKIKSY